jgi:hypothetical protein
MDNTWKTSLLADNNQLHNMEVAQESQTIL